MAPYQESDFTPHAAMGRHVARIAHAGDRGEAARYLAAYEVWLLDRGAEPGTAAANIGYFAGYFDRDTMRAALEVFGVRHPLGATADSTPAELVELGKVAARKVIEG